MFENPGRRGARPHCLPAADAYVLRYGYGIAGNVTFRLYLFSNARFQS